MYRLPSTIKDDIKQRIGEGPKNINMLNDVKINNFLLGNNSFIFGVYKNLIMLY